MKNQIRDAFENDLRRKRHSQKLEMLFKHIKLNPDKIYVSLMGTGQFASGYLKTNTTRKEKRTVNHKTTPEKMIGYADLLYEKRNAVTHNRNEYSNKVLNRLNADWNLQIERYLVVIRRSTIKSVIRFYTSATLKIIETEHIKNAVGEKFSEFTTDLQNLREFKNIGRRHSNSENDKRYNNGGVEGRESILKTKSIWTVNEFAIATKISYSTGKRDFAHYEKKQLIKKSETGKYELIQA